MLQNFIGEEKNYFCSWVSNSFSERIAFSSKIRLRRLFSLSNRRSKSPIIAGISKNMVSPKKEQQSNYCKEQVLKRSQTKSCFFSNCRSLGSRMMMVRIMTGEMP